jgi:hypothetical protein
MLFNAKHFEQFFSEKILKKGLDFFLKREVEPIILQTSRDPFFIVHGFEIILKFRGDKLLAYTCSCKYENYCSHLSAALFYLQKDTFDVKLKDKTQVKIRTAEVLYKKESQAIIKRRKNEIEKLESFIEKQKRQVWAWELKPLISENTLLEKTDIYTLLLDQLIKPFQSKQTLGEKEIDHLERALRAFIENSKVKNNKEAYYLYLTVIGTFIQLFNLRYSGDERKLTDLYIEMCSELEHYSLKGSNTVKENAWHKMLLRSIENNISMSSRVFEFLLVPWVSVTKDKQKLWNIGQTLSKRHLKTSYTERLDKLLIARALVNLRESKLFKTPLPMIASEDTVELIIAKAELNFFSGKSNKAFKILESHYNEIKINKAAYYLDYLEYLLKKATKMRHAEIEIKYLRESFIHGLFILPDKLHYFLHLIPSEKREEEITGLLNSVKRNPFNYSYDKVIVLLWEDQRWDELIIEIKKHKNKFHLLHDVLIKKLPENAPPLLSLYAKHLIASILEKEFYPYQIQLLNKARVYLSYLPEEETQGFMLTVLNGLLKQSQIYRFLKEEYELV